MSNSKLAEKFIKASHFSNGRSGRKIEKIAIHHMAGVLTTEQCGKIFQGNRQASAHYGIGKDGRIAQYVDEKDTAWTNSNWDSNCKCVTIETSNSATGGQWLVSDVVLNKLIELVADIAKRNNLGTLVKGKNVVWHSMYIATTCPGPYLLSKMDYIIEEANKLNNKKEDRECVDVEYQAYDNALKKWWNVIKNYNETNTNGYAGVIGHSMGGLRARLTNGAKIIVKSHVKGGNWLSEITKWDDTSSGYSGLYGKEIDKIMIKAEIPIKYRVHILGESWLAWVDGYDENEPINGYAGLTSKTIDAIQITKK